MNSPYGELVNVDNTHYAKVTADTKETYTTDVPKYLAPAAEIKHEATVDNTPRYYDGKPMFSTPSEAATAVTLTVSGVPSKLAAELTGKPYDATKGIAIDTGDASGAPDYALSGRMELGDGGYRYYQYLKGKFTLGGSTAHTAEDKTTANTVDLNYTAVVTVHEFDVPDGKTPAGTKKSGVKGLTADTTDEAFTSADAWFSKVQTPAAEV